ncbi:MAG: ABC transporter permease [Candidatus Limnocylindrales bacterium]
MDQLSTFLDSIPVLGVVFQLIGYVIATMPDIAPVFVALAAPIALGALCGIMNERSGVVNIGIEGMMLSSAFTAFLVAALVAQAMGTVSPSPIFGATVPILAGVAAGIVTGMLVSVLHAWLSISIRADQIISGTIINIMAFGLTGYLNRLLISPNPRLGAGIFQPLVLPDALVDLPLVGWIIKGFFAHGPITISVLFLVILLQVWLFRSRWGLRTRAVGEHPKAAETVGIDVIRLRYRNVILGGVFAGLAGAFLTLEQSGSFQNGMTSGRGFIALAAVIFGRWTPIGAFGAALLFTASEALRVAISLTPPTGQLGDVLRAIPPEFYGALPYAVTLVVLVAAVGRSVAPAAVGKPYVRETRT